MLFGYATLQNKEDKFTFSISLRIFLNVKKNWIVWTVTLILPGKAQNFVYNFENYNFNYDLFPKSALDKKFIRIIRIMQFSVMKNNNIFNIVSHSE